MSSSHRSSHSSTKGKHSSRSKSSKKDDWSDITDPEERRRVQNRIAQRKFRDKAKDTKEREERDAVNRANAHHAYELTDPRDMSCEDPNGLPWGSVSLIHVMSTGKAKEAESRRGSQSRSRETETQSSYKHSPSQTVWEDPDQDGYYEATSFFDDGDQAYYSGSHEGSSR